MEKEIKQHKHKAIILLMIVAFSLIAYNTKGAGFNIILSTFISLSFFRILVPTYLEKIRNKELRITLLENKKNMANWNESERQAESQKFMNRMTKRTRRFLYVSVFFVVPVSLVINQIHDISNVLIKSLFFSTLIFIAFKLEATFHNERAITNELLEKTTKKE